MSTIPHRGGRRGGGGGRRGKGRGGNTNRTLCTICNHYHDLEDDCPPVCVRCQTRHKPSAACPQWQQQQQQQQAPAVQYAPFAALVTTRTAVGTLETELRQLQARLGTLETTVRQQGDEITSLRQENAGLRGTGPAIASAPADASNVGPLVGRKRGLDEDEPVGGAEAPRKKRKPRWSKNRDASKKRALKGAAGEVGSEGEAAGENTLRGENPLPSLTEANDRSGALHAASDPPPPPQGPLPHQPPQLPTNVDGYPTIDGFVFSERWLVEHTVRDEAVHLDEHLRVAGEVAREIVNRGRQYWEPLVAAARAFGLDLVRQAQQQERQARQQQQQHQAQQAQQQPQQQAQQQPQQRQADADAALAEAAAAAVPLPDDAEAS